MQRENRPTPAWPSVTPTILSSKSHWLHIDFHEQNVPKSVVLRMDKKEYKQIFDAVKTHTGKEVEFPGDAKSKKKDDSHKTTS